jgi:hypothetical protein
MHFCETLCPCGKKINLKIQTTCCENPQNLRETKLRFEHSKVMAFLSTIDRGHRLYVLRETKHRFAYYSFYIVNCTLFPFTFDH